eukprot:11450329-Karenia_brevis.AAC.1
MRQATSSGGNASMEMRPMGAGTASAAITLEASAVPLMPTLLDTVHDGAAPDHDHLEGAAALEAFAGVHPPCVITTPLLPAEAGASTAALD